MRKSPVYLVLFSMALLLGFGSCEKKVYQTIEELDNENINAYIIKNNLTVQQYKNTDLYYQVIQQGTGAEIRFDKSYPMIFTIRSLDGVYNASDTLSASNRYLDFMGYFPFGSSAAGTPNSPVERQDDLKYVVRDVLQQTNGQIRIIVPSRLTGWGRAGSRTLGIPPNASLDYLISVYDDLDDYEDRVIRASIAKAGFSVDDFEKTSDNIYYRIIEAGTGSTITANSTVTAKYTLKDPAGNQLETNTDGVELNLGGGTISAWTKIIPLIRVGGKIRFMTPSKYAYGPSGNENIAPFISLDFEVEIVE